MYIEKTGEHILLTGLFLLYPKLTFYHKRLVCRQAFLSFRDTNAHSDTHEMMPGYFTSHISLVSRSSAKV